MRCVADAGSCLIVFVYIDRDAAGMCDAADKFLHPCDAFLRNSVRRCQNIVAVPQKLRKGIFVTDVFCSCHGMTADKAVVESNVTDRMVDLALHASYIGQDAVRFQIWF